MLQVDAVVDELPGIIFIKMYSWGCEKKSAFSLISSRYLLTPSVCVGPGKKYVECNKVLIQFTKDREGRENKVKNRRHSNNNRMGLML